MSKYNILIVLIGFCFHLAGQSVRRHHPVTEHQAFKNGEYLEYVVRYGFIHGGGGVFTVADTLIGNRPVFHVQAKGFTSGLADAVFRVRDVYESYMDKETHLPVKAIRNIKEGRYRYFDEVWYDRDSNKVHTKKTGTQDVPKNIMDIVSAFYFARSHTFNDQMKIGETIEFITFFSDEIFPLRIKYRGIETISTKFGNLECYKFSPVTEVGRAFKTEDDMHVWISRDGNRLPVKIRFNLAVGSFVCELIAFKGLLHPVSSIRP